MFPFPSLLKKRGSPVEGENWTDNPPYLEMELYASFTKVTIYRVARAIILRMN